MSKGLVAAALLLLITGLAVIFLPLYLPPMARGGAHTESIGVGMTQMQVALARIRDIAEQINAPLSVVVALASLYYSRRGYMIRKRQAGEE
jgi:hypothetical protein